MRMPLRTRIARSWHARDASQRTAWLALVVAALLAAAALLFAAPLRESIARTRSDVARNRVVLEVARSRSDESATLARTPAPAHAGDARAAIGRVLDREGVKNEAAAPSTAEGSEIRIVVPEVPFDTLVRALQALASEEGVRIVEASIIARVEPGLVRAELALAR
jgi:type II secretory pathway component PulM